METAIPCGTFQYSQPSQLRPASGGTRWTRCSKSSVRAVPSNTRASPEWESVRRKRREWLLEFPLPDGSSAFHPIRAEVDVLSSRQEQNARAPECRNIHREIKYDCAPISPRPFQSCHFSLSVACHWAYNCAGYEAVGLGGCPSLSHL